MRVSPLLLYQPTARKEGWERELGASREREERSGGGFPLSYTVGQQEGRKAGGGRGRRGERIKERRRGGEENGEREERRGGGFPLSCAQATAPQRRKERKKRKGRKGKSERKGKEKRKEREENKRKEKNE